MHRALRAYRLAMVDTEPSSEFTRIRRQPDRAAYDNEAVHAVLDAALVAHVGFVDDGQPIVIPMLFGRDGERVFLHGSVASRLQRTLATGIDVCLTVTIVDGLVFARSAFHHSMNYRSAVLLGRAVPVASDDKAHALRCIAEHLTPGRWAESRAPTEPELKQTSVLELHVEHASAKARVGGPIDDADDIDLPIWAGVVPITQSFGAPITEPDSGLPEASPAIVELVD
jgi:hypothetical protein